MEKIALDIKNLRKTYNGKPAVDGITFSIPTGSFFGFLGPNGAGKSTTIQCITGISKFQEGSISLFGTNVVTDYREARKKVGLSPQEYNADIFATTRKTLDYVAGYYGLPKAVREERVEKLMTDFGLLPYADRKFQELSGGYKRRVMLARAMVHDPKLLILDEPTAGVDVELRHELWNILSKLNKDGKTILLTSHYLEEIELLCERIAIINQGKIAAIGTKEEFTRDGKRLEEKYLSITKGETW